MIFSTIQSFQKLCEDSFCKSDDNTPDLSIPKNRFTCMDLLDAAIRKKRGAYTEIERRNWLKIIYTCLRAPNSFFIGREPDIYEKRVKKFSRKLHSFEDVLLSDIENPSIFNYIDCVQAHKQNTKDSVRRAIFPIAAQLKNGILQALEKDICENQKLKEYRDQYESTLQEAFGNINKYLHQPSFFLLLPVYLFYELAKCEGLVKNKDVDVFSCLRLSSDYGTWTVHEEPFNFSHGNYDEKYQRLEDLYDTVEYALCEVLEQENYCSIGASLWTEIRKGDRFNPIYQFVEYSDDKLLEDNLVDASVFTAPLWSYDIWIKFLLMIFSDKGDKSDGLNFQDFSDTMRKSFSLTFRNLTHQSNQSLDSKLESYKTFNLRSRKNTFCLADIMKALAEIYKPRFSNTNNQFEDENFCSAIDQITDLLIATNHSNNFEYEHIIDKWLDLLRFGHPFEFTHSLIEYSSEDDLMVVPSRVIFQALLRRSEGIDIERYKTVFFSGTSLGKYQEAPARKLSKSLLKALCSEKAVIKDIATWGGIEIDSGRDREHVLLNTIHIYANWNARFVEPYLQFFKRIKKDKKYLKKIAAALQESPEILATVDLSALDFSNGHKIQPMDDDDGDIEEDEKEKRKILDEQRSKLYESFPPKIIKPLRQLPKEDDFHYTLILYFLFHALRDRMCLQAYEFCKKLLSLS